MKSEMHGNLFDFTHVDNRDSVLAIVHKQPGITMHEIVEITGLDNRRICKVVSSLLKYRLVTKTKGNKCAPNGIPMWQYYPVVADTVGVE